MLPKKERLTTEAFDRFFASGKRHHTKNLQLITSPHKNFHSVVVVGKKVYKKAVDRNKLRRRLYSVVYHHKTKFRYTGVFIVIAKPSAKKSTYVDLKNELETILARLAE